MSKKTHEVRQFSKTQKQAIYEAAGGICESCGKELTDDYEADHVIPYSKDGSTDVLNGQALCRDCNRQKGNKVMKDNHKTSIDTSHIPLREWQKAAASKFHESGAEDFLIQATPGAGKTTAGLTIAKDLLDAGQIERVVVLVPTDHLRTQWGKNASKHGIHLDYKFDASHYTASKGERKELKGMVLTYAQVAIKPDLYRIHTGKEDTLVILDEIHHAGEHRSWGGALNKAFGIAKFRLALTGTPFRTDGWPIPFISYEYNSEGKQVAKPDYSYNYKEAFRDDVVRQVVFNTKGGRMTWEVGTSQISADFNHMLNEVDTQRRLHTAISAEGDWLRDVLTEADTELRNLRTQQPDAAGIVFARDQKHAREIAELLEQITGDPPVVAISDDPEASKRIEKFGGNFTEPWIVSVKMVSEGVDIPRLRVGVFATTTVTTLFFYQAIGRVLRNSIKVDVTHDPCSYFYIPEDRRLLSYAKSIEDDISEVLREQSNANISTSLGNNQNQVMGEFSVVSSQSEQGPVITNGTVYPPEEMQVLEVAADQAHMPVWLFERAIRDVDPRVIEIVNQRPATTNLIEENEKLRKETNKLVNRLAYKTGLEHSDIHMAANELAMNGEPTQRGSIQELRKKRNLLAGLMNRSKEDVVRDLGGLAA